jgi:hypothetical protein
MTKDNHGKYIKSQWDDKDPITWKWQIDHINPQSDYPYDSMDHPNFLIVWDLSNLRPLSAKRNHDEGVNRIRHKNKNQKVLTTDIVDKKEDVNDIDGMISDIEDDLFEEGLIDLDDEENDN